MLRRFAGFYALMLPLTYFPVAAQTPLKELQLGTPFSQQQQPGEPGFYEISATAGDFVRFDLDQAETQLRVTILGPTGATVSELTMPSESYGEFPIYFSAHSSGVYRLRVDLVTATAGAYRVRLQLRRPSAATDQDSLDALEAYFHAWRLRATGDRQSLERATEEFNKACSLFHSNQSVIGEGACLVGAGVAYADLSQNEKAIDLQTQALQLWRNIGNRNGEAFALLYRGFAEYRMGRIDPAVRDLQQALLVARDVGSKKATAKALSTLAAVSGSSLGDPTTAIQYLKEALGMQRAVGDRSAEAATLNNLASMYAIQGDSREALKVYAEVLQLFQQQRDARMEALTHYNLARSYNSVSEEQHSLDHLAAALVILKQIRDQRWTGLVLSSMGSVYETLGERERALTCYNEALTLQSGIGDKRGAALTMGSIGHLLTALHKYQEASETLRHGLAEVKDLGDLRAQWSMYYYLGDLQKLQGQKQESLESLTEALRIGTVLEDRYYLTYSHLSLALAYKEWRERESGRKEFLEALSAGKTIEDRLAQTASLYGLAQLAAEDGELIEARSRIEAAVGLVESLRAKLVDPQLRVTYFASVRDLYDLQVDILMRLHFRDPDQHLSEVAFEASELGRARGLLDTLAEAHVNIQRGVDQALLDQATSFRDRLAARADQQLRLLNGKHTDVQADGIQKQLDQLINELRDAETRIRQASPRYGALTQPQIAAVRAVQTKLLDSDTVLLEYALGEHRSYVWAITKESVSTFELPTRTVVDAAAKRLYAAIIVNPGSGKSAAERSAGSVSLDEPARAATALSHILIDPVKELIKGKRILVVADGALQYIPFVLLREPVSSDVAPFVPLIEAHEVINVSSASALLAMRDQPISAQKPEKLVAVFADPVFDKSDPRVGAQQATQHSNPAPGKLEVQSASAAPVPSSLARSAAEVGLVRSDSTLPRLPFTRREADAILGTVPRGQGFEALDFQASIDTLNSPATAQYQVLHFATHGLLNTSRPALSGLVLSLVSPDGQPLRGYLELADIYNLNLAAGLVVLSACQTGLGKEVKGEGLIGLTRGFLFAGARGVVSSLWKVDDAATAALMDDFYHGMFSRHLRPAAALREAEIGVWKQRRWASPYFWSAFVYEGDWR